MTAEPAEGATPGTPKPSASEAPGTLHLARWTATSGSNRLSRCSRRVKHSVVPSTCPVL